MSHIITLPPRVDISVVPGLRDEWLASASASSEVTIECKNVSSFSAAAAQLIISFSSMMRASGGMVSLTHIPEQLRADFITLGLPEYL